MARSRSASPDQPRQISVGMLIFVQRQRSSACDPRAGPRDRALAPANHKLSALCCRSISVGGDFCFYCFRHFRGRPLLLFVAKGIGSTRDLGARRGLSAVGSRS